MVNNPNETFKLFTDLLLRQNKLDKPYYDLGDLFEDHHFIGKINSRLIYKLHKPRHDFITSRLNYLSRSQRKQPYIVLLVNVIASIELLAFELHHIMYQFIHNPTKQNLVNELTKRRFNLEDLMFILKKIMDMLHYE